MKEKVERRLQEIWEFFICKRFCPSISSASGSNLFVILKKLKWNTANVKHGKIADKRMYYNHK